MKTLKNIILTLSLTLVLIPISMMSQNEKNNEPLTPYANITFSDSLIVYWIPKNLVMQYQRLRPTKININILRLRYSNEHVNISGSDIEKSQAAITEYVNDSTLTLSSDKEKEDFIKLCALVAIWGNKVNTHSTGLLQKLSAQSESNEQSKNAESVLKLVEFYKENNLPFAE